MILFRAVILRPFDSPEAERLHAYDHAHYIWFFWVGVGILAFIALLVFKFVTDRIDARKESPPLPVNLDAEKPSGEEE